MPILPANSTIVLASSNAGKLKELDLLLRPFGYELKLQSELGIDDAEETGLTFVENSILKARNAAVASGLPALADDSGIEVDALQGKPGIYSARFATLEGRGSGDADNNTLLLEKLQGLPCDKRSARFRCVLTLFRHANDPSPLLADGSWEGHILEAPSGENGFGYDPLFFATDQQQAAADLLPEVKARVSHRGQALQQLKQQLDRADS